jgi:hypothetical protein
MANDSEAAPMIKLQKESAASKEGEKLRETIAAPKAKPVSAHLKNCRRLLLLAMSNTLVMPPTSMVP